MVGDDQLTLQATGWLVRREHWNGLTKKDPAEQSEQQQKQTNCPDMLTTAFQEIICIIYMLKNQ